jgi:hypothetical protein
MAWTDKNRSGQYNSTQTCGVDMMGLERQKKSGQQNQHSNFRCYVPGQTKTNLDNKTNTQAYGVDMSLDRQK